MSDSKEKYILAIDHGTSGPKSAIISTNGNVIDWVFREVPLLLPEPGAAEQNPDNWWNGFLEGAKEMLDKKPVPIEDIVGVCNTSQWSGTIPMDEHGNHLMNCMIWMDTRGAEQAQKFHDSFLNIGGYAILKSLPFLKRTGGALSLSGKDPIEHIMWIKDHLSEIYEKTYKFLEPQDYMNYKLTGKIATSEATIHCHWITDIRDINNIHYSKKLIKKLKLDINKFPEIKKTTDILGQITKEVQNKLGLNSDTKVIMGAPDLHSATIGSGAIRMYEGHFCIGTSDWLLCHVPYKKTSVATNMASAPSGIPGKYMIINEQEIAGGTLSFLRDKILYHKDELLQEEQVPDVYKIFDKIVERTPPGANRLLFTPWLYGERAPIDDHTIRGGIYNLSLDSNREDLIRAVFEGVAFNVKWLLIAIEKFIKKWVEKEKPEQIQYGKIIPELTIIGGGANSKIWCQIFADVMDRTIKQLKNPIQVNARGAAFIASAALGYIEWDDIPDLIEYENIFEPNPDNRKLYDNLFEEYKNIYKAMKKIYKRLNKH